MMQCWLIAVLYCRALPRFVALCCDASTCKSECTCKQLHARSPMDDMVLDAQNGQIPKLSAIVEDSDSEEEPDAVVHIPINKVKLVVGAGGEKIKHIQRKSKCRLQVCCIWCCQRQNWAHD